MRSRRLLITVLASATAMVLPTACSTGKASTGGDSASSQTVPSASSTASVAAPSGESDAVAFQQAAPGSGKGLKIGLITLDDSVPFSKLVSDSIKKQAKQAGATLVYCDSKGDGATALACARNFKVQGVKGYLNFQSDAKSADAICAAGPSVPVIAIDIAQGSCQTSFMGANNEFAGNLAGKALGTYMKQKFDCKYDAFVSMEEPDAGEVNTARMGGYRKGFESVCGPVKNLKTENAFRIDQARTTFADVLTTLPGAHRIVVAAINDDAIEGALAAAKTAGRAKDLFVSGQGADPSSWCDIKSNQQWVGDTAYFPERYGEIGVPYLIKAIKGETVPEKLLVPHQIINSANITDVYHPSC
ncbi:sugar ABC transporter substrate-binding protein [Actinacidiphila alni]|uniref:Monosaccharide ABC transporter substrate-binding protein, CUT2 family n=1 Tax=Actinacidiphila alni TaxID=380248 RepID=A0A1I2H7A6_9ACTN|nr:sugar ABC transporter substrate-binding protein [Actinacidiphila alni]SFF25572.1 monosaccharide ABC transporter substrate-binding protein, CUT2 family [Actinacidiphila alni]